MAGNRLSNLPVGDDRIELAGRSQIENHIAVAEQLGMGSVGVFARRQRDDLLTDRLCLAG